MTDRMTEEKTDREMRVCRECKTAYPLEMYYRTGKNRTSYSCRCKDCYNIKAVRNYHANKPAIKPPRKSRDDKLTQCPELVEILQGRLNNGYSLKGLARVGIVSYKTIKKAIDSGVLSKPTSISV